jgi:hypothetical protein
MESASADLHVLSRGFIPGGAQWAESASADFHVLSRGFIPGDSGRARTSPLGIYPR